MQKYETTLGEIFMHILHRHPEIEITEEMLSRKGNVHLIRELGQLHKDRIFYIIRRKQKTAGLLSYYFTALSHIRYAIERNWTPIVDLSDAYYPLVHENEAESGNVNGWDNYFLQPTTFTAKDVIHASNVIISDRLAWNHRYVIDQFEFERSPDLTLWKSIAKIYARIRPSIQYEMDNVFEQLFEPGSKILGINFRKGYNLQRPSNHGVQPDEQTVFKDAESLFTSGEYTHVFLSTEDFTVIEFFSKRFGSCLKYIDRPRVNSKFPTKQISDEWGALMREIIESDRTDQFMESIKFDRANDRFLKNKEYLTEVYVLSKCKGIIIARTGGMLMAYLLKDGEFANALHYDERY